MRFPCGSCGGFLLALAVACSTPVHAVQSDSQSLEIVTQSPQPITPGDNFTLPLVANGAFPPYTWHRIEGQLPPGLKLHPHMGTISGVPTTPGEYHFKLLVTDSSVPHHQAQRDFTIVVVAGVSLDWKEAPKVQGAAILGSAVVINETGHPLDLTVIVVAVNAAGRATALGYQHFTLAGQTSSPEIPFSSSPGLGTYYVRADAAAHRPSGHRIYRASKQSENNLQVTQF